jgi:Concanavalin A-like lectin/glucanases superfamily
MKRLWILALILGFMLVVLIGTNMVACGDGDDANTDDNIGEEPADDDDFSPPTDDDDDDDDVIEDDDDDDDDDTDDPESFLSAVAFAGTDGYGWAPSSFALQIHASMTVEAWVQIQQYPVDYYSVVDVRSSDKLVSAGYALTIEDGGNVNFCIGQNVGETCVATSVPIELNTWNHIAGVHDYCSSSITVYLNGQDIGYGSSPAEINSSSADLWIARHPTSIIDYDSITVDEIRISAGVRYFGEEFEAPNEPLPVDEFTAALWHFDEGLGNTVADQTTNGNFLTLDGNYTWVTH